MYTEIYAHTHLKILLPTFKKVIVHAIHVCLVFTAKFLFQCKLHSIKKKKSFLMNLTENKAYKHLRSLLSMCIHVIEKFSIVLFS